MSKLVINDVFDEFELLISKPENELEGWSKIAWPVIKEYLSK